MDFTTKILGRFLFALPFIVFGLLHLVNAHGMVPLVPGWIPGQLFWVILTGLAMFAAGISFIIRIWDRLAGFLLGLMLLIFVFTIHLPLVMSEPMSAMGDLLKDTALAGAAWLYAGYIGKRVPPAAR